eukprot:TRINITY_DN47895_c0_g1_i1.p1 TRINITY_DN47895_c0_g1~~TRINITY_DN47895_c0_g1_i1.p1  ORF type:complete len:412 (-),score=63.88 TRINITY_DN47895_c0_g1_i1:103-1338(-)
MGSTSSYSLAPLHAEEDEECSLLEHAETTASGLRPGMAVSSCAKSFSVIVTVLLSCCLLWVRADLGSPSERPALVASPTDAISLEGNPATEMWWPPKSKPWMAKLRNQSDGMDLCMHANDASGPTAVQLEQCSKIRRGQWFFERGGSIAWLAHPELCLAAVGHSLGMDLCNDEPSQKFAWDPDRHVLSAPGGRFVSPQAGRSLLHAGLRLLETRTLFERFSPPVEVHGHNTIEVHYEAYCPNCRDFLSHQLPFLAGRLAEHSVTWKFYPYGLAHRGPSQTVLCQHGPNECEANRFAACAIDFFGGDGLLAVPFLYCLESKLSRLDPSKAARLCVRQAGLPSWSALLSCSQGAQGQKLLAQAGSQARAQGVDSVPHVVVNGQYLSAPWRLLEDIGVMKPEAEGPPCSEEHPC